MRPPAREVEQQPRISLARALSKLGFCSRRQAEAVIATRTVTVNGQRERDPRRRLDLARDRIAVDGAPVQRPRFVYLMLNKPRGLVTTRADEKGRATVYDCLDDPDLPWVAPVGRLDRASEGLLLFTNDTGWAARLLDPASHVDKTYHVQIDRLADDALLARLRAGVPVSRPSDREAEISTAATRRASGQTSPEWLAVKRVSVLRSGGKHCWLEIVLDEGKNRHLRRLFEALGIAVLRLIRVAIGALPLGDLPKGAWRFLTPAECQMLARRRPSRRRHPAQPAPAR
ncbi:MAG: Ribosomal large subunit pseudouridine synthase B [Candidatus Ozemobacter sibiricus]|jgi:23S rRNA pseudouridine2605 synthase|uniref:Pseudouridine synthase n=1 Tax=Candidatus Ozemobacter sibiricus TaxID=2268124 RepID=A0A367ZTB7_9BACT|nr:MAG: Ribosomal large subunit pseudouridine synthase B [Candidatus Ozemobacter sibiricus]